MTHIETGPDCAALEQNGGAQAQGPAADAADGTTKQPASVTALANHGQPDSRSPYELVVAEDRLIKMLMRHYGWRMSWGALRPPANLGETRSDPLTGMELPSRDRICLASQADVPAVVVDFASGDRSIWLYAKAQWSSRYGRKALPKDLQVQEVIL